MFDTQKSTCCCGGLSLGFGIIFLIVAIGFPILINNGIKESVVPSVALTKQNEK